MAHVVFLRGVNVGGHRTLRPAVLAQKLRHLGAVNIGAAGTFVIRKPISAAKVRSEFMRRLPFESAITICRSYELERLLAANVFGRTGERPDIVRFVSVLSAKPRMDPPLPRVLPAKGPWLVKVLRRDGLFVSGMYRRQMKTIGCLGKLDDMFSVPVTTRNWNTLTAIAKAVRKQAEKRSRVSTARAV